MYGMYFLLKSRKFVIFQNNNIHFGAYWITKQQINPVKHYINE